VQRNFSSNQQPHSTTGHWLRSEKNSIETKEANIDSILDQFICALFRQNRALLAAQRKFEKSKARRSRNRASCCCWNPLEAVLADSLCPILISPWDTFRSNFLD
jgi:hypothetical protein